MPKLRSVFLLLLCVLQPILLFSRDSIDNQKKINEMNLLFPHIYEILDSRQIEYKLTAYNGCYEWSSSNENLFNVNGIPDDNNAKCQSNAVVSLVKSKTTNQSSWIFAKDRETGDVLRVKAKIAEIARIEIITKSRTIDVEDMQVLEVVGYDKDGNMFSTLEGVKFEWAVSKCDNILELVSIKDSSIKATDLRKKLETQLIQTDIIIVKGKSPGNCLINAKLVEKDYKIEQSSVRMYIMQHFTIIPETELFVLKRSLLKFKLNLIKRTESSSYSEKEIALPSPNHNWKIDREDLGEIQQSGSLRVKNELGSIRIIVDDSKSENSVENVVHVVDPEQMELNIVQLDEKATSLEEEISFDNIWNLVVGRKYLMRASLFDYLHNSITITENFNFKFIFEQPEVFEIIKRSNKDITFIPKKKAEKINVQAYLDGYEISCTKTVGIYSQIKLIKPDYKLHLPTSAKDIEKETPSVFKLFVVGGSDHYEWGSEDLEVAIVSQEGLVKSKRKGKTWIEVHDRLNYKNKEKIEIEVTNFAHLRSLEELKEIIVKDSDFVYVIAEDEHHKIYSNCSGFLFDLSQVYENAFETYPKIDSYDSLLDDLELLSTNYKSFNNLFKSSLYKRPTLDYDNYRSYISMGELTSDRYREILSFYRNYGVCSKVRVSSNYHSDITTKIFAPTLQNQIQSASLQIRFVEKFKITHPEIELMNSDDPEILLTPESSFEWHLEGGPNLWEETRNINEIYEVEDKETGHITSHSGHPSISITSLSKFAGQKIRRQYFTKCNLQRGGVDYNKQRFAIRMFSWNEPDSKLLKPVNVSVELSVSCKIPSKLQIYTFEQYSPQLNIYQTKILGLEAVNLKNYAEHHFQVFAFDENFLPFYNFSSLAVNWRITKPTACISLHRIELDDEEICKICKDQYTKLSVKDCNEELILRAETSSLKDLFQKFSFPNLFDEIALSVLPNLQLTPSRAILYYDLQNTIDIKILYGSGYFSVKTNDSEILSYEYDRSSSIITVSPLKRGYVKIIVEDQKLEHSRPAICEIVISDAFFMKLKTETNLLPVGNKTLLTVQVQELHHENFPVEQYHLMRIHLQIDIDSDYLKNNALKISNNFEDNHIFIVEGTLVGSYKVKAFMVPNMQVSISGYISSNVVELHVFEPMKIKPGELLMAPACLSTVELFGGPSEKSKVLNNVVLEASISGRNVATFKELSSGIYEIYGQSTGKTEMTFVLKYKDSNKFISSTSLDITVALVNDVQILGMIDRKLHIGSVVRLIAISKYDSLIFSNQICNFHYSWVSSDPNVLHIPALLPNLNPQKSGVNIENYLNMAVNASALTEGTSDVILTLQTKYDGYDGYFSSSSLRTSVKVRVVDPLITEIPVNFNQQTAQPALLLIPPNSGYKLVTNKDVSKLKFNNFRGQTDHEIEIDDVGNIKTTQNKGKYTVLVEDYGVEKQLMVVNILVTNIYSIILENSYKVLYLPTDSEIKLKLILQDSFGRHFPKNIENVEFGIHITNPKIVDLKVLSFDQSVVVKAKSVGSSICFVYLEENSNVYDVFVINVGSIVTPSSPVYVHLGGVVYFTANSPQSNNEYKWISEDPNILDITNNGKASALKEGKTNIMISDTIHHLTRVNVYKASKILLNEAKSPSKISSIPSNPFYQEEYRFYFRVISDEREVKLFNNVGKSVDEQINNNLRFDCEARENDLLQVRGEITYSEAEKQQVAVCSVKMKQYGSSQSTSKTATLRAIVSSNTPNLFVLHQDFSIDIIPDFQISPRDYLVELNSEDNTRIIAINSVEDLSFHADNDFINNNLKGRFDSSRNIFFLNISVPENKVIKRTVESNIKIYNFLTNQTEFIRVIFDPVSSGYPRGSSYISKETEFSFSILDGIITVICCLVLLLVVNQVRGTPGRTGF